MAFFCCVSMYSKVCRGGRSLLLRSVQSIVVCVYTRMFVLRADVFGYQSLFVCVCVGVQFFLPLSSPSCVASRSHPIGSPLPSHHHLPRKRGTRRRGTLGKSFLKPEVMLKSLLFAGCGYTNGT